MSNRTGPLESLPAQREAINLACCGMMFRIHTDNSAAAAWLLEFVQPWFTSGTGSATHVLSIQSSRDLYDDARGRQPSGATHRACYAFDQMAFTLPSWTEDEATVFHDAERSCVLRIDGTCVTLLADPSSRRWRMHLLWMLCEIVATEWRRSQVDLHAAAVEFGGQGIALCGPKMSGKSTLLLNLLLSGRFRFVSNDRVFIDGHQVRGIPTAVKLRPDTLTRFPNLVRGLPAVSRPYLHNSRELGEWPDGLVDREVAEFFALSTAQFAKQLGAEAAASAPLKVLLFPRLDPEVDSWRLEGLTIDECAAALRANPYGNPPPRNDDQAGTIARAVAGFRLTLGPNAYDDPDFAVRLMNAMERG